MQLRAKPSRSHCPLWFAEVPPQLAPLTDGAGRWPEPDEHYRVMATHARATSRMAATLASAAHRMTRGKRSASGYDLQHARTRDSRHDDSMEVPRETLR